MNGRAQVVTSGRESRWRRYFAAALGSALCTVVALLMSPYFDLANLVMVYLLGTTVVALLLGRGPAGASAVVNVAAFDYFFLHPRFTMAVTDMQYLLTFAAMLIVALTIATLVASVRAQKDLAAAGEGRMAALHAMTRALAASRSLDELVPIATRRVAETFGCEAQLLLSGAAEAADGSGRFTTKAFAQYVPLQGTGYSLGFLVVGPAQSGRITLLRQQHLLEAFAGQIALAIERVRLAEDVERAGNGRSNAPA